MITELKNSTTLCAIFRDEREYVLEWVAYHKLLGFSDIIIYSNECQDGTDHFLDELQARGYLTHIRWPDKNGVSAQVSAYNDALTHCKSAWILFIDADEFLFLDGKMTINEFIDTFPDDVSAIALNWKIFGSSGLTKRDGRLVVERFTRRAPDSFAGNLHCKTISRTQSVANQHIHRSHLKSGRYVNASGFDIEILRNGFTPSLDYSLCSINHYVVKSLEEFSEKCRRGNANRPPESKDKYTGRGENYFIHHDRNEIEDRAIQILVPELKVLMEDMKIKGSY